uniref:non-specific serine/threonine protein kinase n=2 Tax=Latimeria chalumnae TaxID=7897 RepID=H3B9R4_LATCH
MMEQFLLSKGYLMGKTIGEGTYSKVKEAFCKKQQKTVAVKIIDKEAGPPDFIQKFLPRELQIAQTLDHENIIKVYESIESEDGKIYLIMELAKGGDIFELIVKTGPLPEEQAQALFQQLVKAIRYCHDRGVAHRDLKCENTLLGDELTLKLADFGFAKIFSPGSTELTKTFCGSMAYAAPEVLQGVPHDSRGSDIWSMGVVLYVMLCGHLPFDDTDIPKMLWHQQNGISFPNHLTFSQGCRDLVRRMLEPDVTLRLSIEDICRHGW